MTTYILVAEKALPAASMTAAVTAPVAPVANGVEMDAGREWAGDLHVEGDASDPANSLATFAGVDGEEGWLDQAADGTLTGWVKTGDGTIYRYSDADAWALDVDGAQMTRSDQVEEVVEEEVVEEVPDEGGLEVDPDSAVSAEDARLRKADQFVTDSAGAEVASDIDEEDAAAQALDLLHVLQRKSADGGAVHRTVLETKHSPGGHIHNQDTHGRRYSVTAIDAALPTPAVVRASPRAPRRARRSAGAGRGPASPDGRAEARRRERRQRRRVPEDQTPPNPQDVYNGEELVKKAAELDESSPLDFSDFQNRPAPKTEEEIARDQVDLNDTWADGWGPVDEGLLADAQKYKKRSALQQAKEDYAVYVANAYLRAEEATRGSLLSKKAQAENMRRSRRNQQLIDPEGFFDGKVRSRDIPKWASEELLRWWGEGNRPMSFPDWAVSALGWSRSAANGNRNAYLSEFG